MTYRDRLCRDLDATADSYVGGSALDGDWPSVLGWSAGVIVKRVRALRIARAFKRAGGYDLVFVHRILPPEHVVDAIAASSARLVFDYDDALSIEGFLPQDIARRRFDYIVRHADLVVTSTDVNAQAIRQMARRVEVIPSSIDLSRVGSIKQHSTTSPVAIGWIGSPSTQKYLDFLSPPLQRVARTLPISFESIGASGDVAFGAIPSRNSAWHEETEYDLLEACDIGVMPLPDDEWTRSKGGFKLLQYMAKGLPVVASPVGVNKELVRHGENGFLASTTEEWEKALETLARSPELRATMGRAGRALVESSYATDQAYGKLISAIRSILS